MPSVVPRLSTGFISLPEEATYILANCSVPAACLNSSTADESKTEDGVVRCNIVISNGTVKAISSSSEHGVAHPTMDLEGGLCFPAFVDLHTHIDKGHTCERSRNPTGSLTGADRSTAQDANFWNLGDVFWRMDFSIRCAYAHGTCALRTHLINMVPKQLELTWPAFDRLRKKWKGKVELQGVSLVTLSYYRDEQAAEVLADTVANYDGILGAAVCCSDKGGLESDDWTTCDKDRSVLLDRIFMLAKKRGLLLDFHVDENGNERSRGLYDIALKTIEHGYEGRVVCGHCCSLAWQSDKAISETIAAVKKAQICVVSLPLVNEWTQDRDPKGLRTPRWRGITALQELQSKGASVAMASDNTRDQFYQYGDLDMLEVFTQGVRLGQLDRPISAWPASVTAVPAKAMHLQDSGKISVGAPADLVLFRARKFSELLSRPQTDRVAVRGGRPIAAIPPDYKLLDYDPHKQVYLYANMRLSNDSFIDNQGGMGKARASFIGAEDCAELKSYPSQADLRQSTGSEAPEAIVRGLSVVLPSEAISSPPGLVTHTSSSVETAAIMQIGDDLSVISGQVHSSSDRDTRETLNGMQKIPESDPSAATCLWASACGSAASNGKAQVPRDASRRTNCKSTMIPGNQQALQLSPVTLSCIMLGSGAVGALAAFMMLRR